MGQTKTGTNVDRSWTSFTETLIGPEQMPDCIECRINLDGTLDYTPLPLGMRNIWLFNNGGETNDVY